MSALTYLDTALRSQPSATILKVTAVLAATCAMALVVRRSSAAVRHVVWLAGLVTAAALMLLTPLAPSIGVSIAPEQSVSLRADAPRASVVAGGGVESSLPSMSRVTTREMAPRAAIDTSARRLLDGLFGAASLLAIWAIGAVVVVVRGVVGHVVVARLIRRARVLTNSDGFARGVGHVRLLVSDRLATPVTTSWLRPAIILPATASEWTDERRRIVLEHEMAHIVRGDVAAQTVATFALAVLWFHPLAWLAVARLKAEAEYAADDVVLSSGTSGVVYASHLLELAKLATPTRLSAAVAVGVVRSSHVERRFRAILDDRRSRRPLAWRSISMAAASAVVVLSPLAGLKTVARAMTAPAVQSPTPPRVEPDVDSILDKTIDAVAGARLRISLETGGGVILHGWDSPRMRMRARLGGDDWRDVRIGLAREGRDARLSSTFAGGGTHGTELWFEIWVPRRTDVDLSSAGGSVEIDRVVGSLSGHTGGGAIEIRDATGRAHLSTGGGEITVRDAHLDGSITSGWGVVRIENNSGDLAAYSNGPAGRNGSRFERSALPSKAPPSDFPPGAPPPMARETHEVSITNTNGSCVAVSVGNVGSKLGYYVDRGPYAGNGPLSISKPGGSIRIESAPAGGTVSTGGGSIVVDSSDRSFVASTGGGDIELRASSGDAVASTGAGNVAIRVVGAGSARHNINVCDGSGRVTIELPRDIDARLELETAYTENHPGPTTIESDFGLARDETHEWDDQHGTPRKFVRASGTVGAGTSLIRVTTVNGDIIVRRR